MGATLITYLQYDLLKTSPRSPISAHSWLPYRSSSLPWSGLENIGSITIGLIMIGIIIFEPLGMFGAWIRLKKYWMTWPVLKKRCFSTVLN